jgi:hypothetical protein
VLEKYKEAYQNPWFLIAKKKIGEYQLINIVIKINEVMLRDANLPPLVDKFLEEFIRYMAASLINFFSRYN